MVAANSDDLVAAQPAETLARDLLGVASKGENRFLRRHFPLPGQSVFRPEHSHAGAGPPAYAFGVKTCKAPSLRQ